MAYVCFNIDCSVDIPRGQVKRCARCRVATYCSKACQVSAWKTNHKDNCILHDGLVLGPNGKLIEPDRSTEAGRMFHLEKRLDRWLQHWRRVIYGFTPFAQDLANNPDRPESHVMAIWIKPNNDPRRDKLRDFIVQRARMVPVEEILRYSACDDGRLNRDPNEEIYWPDVVMFRTALVVNDPSQIPGRIMRHGFRDIAQWREMAKDASAHNARVWAQTLMHWTSHKTPAESMDILKGGTIGDSDDYFID